MIIFDDMNIDVFNVVFAGCFDGKRVDLGVMEGEM